MPVLGYGTDEFPSFFSRSSGFGAPMRVDSPAEVAALVRAKWDLGLAGGVVVANPIPAESEIPAEEIGAIIDRALADMDSLGITGKDATPYLLGRIVEISDGASLDGQHRARRAQRAARRSDRARVRRALAGAVEVAAASGDDVRAERRSDQTVDPAALRARRRPRGAAGWCGAPRR